MNATGVILAKALEIVQLGAKRPTVAKLAGFLQVDETSVLLALRDAPDHVQATFGLAVATPAMPPDAFRANRPADAATSPFAVKR